MEINTQYNQTLLVHERHTPPHLFTDMITFKFYRQYETIWALYSYFKEHLLPFPYKTNCVNYNTDNQYAQSRADCIVKYMNKLEYEKCGCNAKWYYGRVNDNHSRICYNNCNVKY